MTAEMLCGLFQHRGGQNPVDSWKYELCDFSASKTHLILCEVWSDKTSTISLSAFHAVISVILPAS